MWTCGSTRPGSSTTSGPKATVRSATRCEPAGATTSNRPSVMPRVTERSDPPTTARAASMRTSMCGRLVAEAAGERLGQRWPDVGVVPGDQLVPPFGRQLLQPPDRFDRLPRVDVDHPADRQFL